MAVKTTCANHPARVASGICRHCSKAVCSECITKIEGINVCAACLAKTLKADTRRRQSNRAQGAAARGVLLVVSFAGLTAVLFLYEMLLLLTS